MAYGRCAIYDFTGDGDELAQKAKAAARAGDRAAKKWVSENDMSMTLTDTYFGEFAWLEFAQQ